MGFGGAMLALTAIQAVNQAGQGYVRQAEAEYEATILEGQAKMLDFEKGLESQRYKRAQGQAMATSMARTAASGLRPSGSNLAVMLDTQKQMGLDRIIMENNYEIEKRYKLHSAENKRTQGRLAVQSGYMNAFSTLLKGGSNYAMSKGFSKDMKGGGVSRYGNTYGKNTPSGTFDTGTYSATRAGRI